MKCTSCNGNGELTFDRHSEECGTYAVCEPCDECDGTGKQNQAEQSAEGATMFEVGELRSFDDLASTMARFNESQPCMSAQEAADAIRRIQQRANDIACTQEDEPMKRMVLDGIKAMLSLADAIVVIESHRELFRVALQ